MYIESSKKIIIKTDKIIENVDLSSYDIIILPGGPGTTNYFKYDNIKKHLYESKNNSQLIAAICAAPIFLSYTQILNDQSATCFPDLVDDLIKNGDNVHYVDEDVVVSNNIITSKSAGTAMEFSLKLIEMLFDRNKMLEIKKSIYY